MEIFNVLSLLVQFLISFLPFIILILFISSLKKVFQSVKKISPLQEQTTQRNKPLTQQQKQTRLATYQTKNIQRNAFVQQARNFAEITQKEFLKKETTTQKKSQSKKNNQTLAQKTNGTRQTVSSIANTPKREKVPSLQPSVLAQSNQIIDTNQLVQAMIYKEILDKPLALRD